MNTTYPAGLCKKLLAVMAEVDYIQKDKTNVGQKYRYASEAVIKEKLHAALTKNGVLILPVSMSAENIATEKKSSSGTPYLITKVSLKCAFVDSETGESIEVESVGYGEDPGDKGVYKAITGALKYLLTTSFLIETGDDPENDEKEVSREESLAKIAAKREAKLAVAAVPTEQMTDEEIEQAKKLLTDQIKAAYKALPEEKKTLDYFKSVAGIAGWGDIATRNIGELKNILKVLS